jgi:hypothetical protein
MKEMATWQTRGLAAICSHGGNEKERTTGRNVPMLYFHFHAEEGVAVDVNVAVLADYANVSQDGKLNIMGIFQEINPPFLPFPMPQMYLVLSFSAGPAEFDTVRDIRIPLLHTDGQELLSMETQMTVPRPNRPGSRAYINQAVGLAGVVFERPGAYAFSVLVGNDEKATVPLYVNEPTPGGAQ